MFFYNKKIILLLTTEAMQPWISSRKGIFEYFLKQIVPENSGRWSTPHSEENIKQVTKMLKNNPRKIYARRNDMEFNRITLSDRNRIQTHYHLVSKWTLHSRTKWLHVRIPLLPLKLQILHLFGAPLGVPWHSGNYRV